MKKVAVIGLYAIKNAGDNILCEATQYLIKQKNPEVQIVEVDVNPRIKSYKGLELIPFWISKVLIRVSGSIFKYENSSRFRYYYEYFMWWLKINHKFKTQLKDVDAIVFAGGGFLKFRTQGLNYYVEQIMKIARKNNIPVMMNGVGIEGYSETDIRCQRLKKAINQDCFKVITTRDDIDTLKNNYIVNPNIKIAHVGDPALWVPECYNMKRNENPSNVVGINVIRGRVYQAYGNTLSEFELLNFYKKLVQGVEERGWDWVLFSNGMAADQKFGAMLLRALGCSDRRKILPTANNSVEFLEQIRSFKLVFGARLHACITSYALDVPVVGLIWSEKLRIFADVIGKKDSFFEENELNIDNILDAMEREMNSNYDKTIRDDLRTRTKNYLEMFMDMLDN
ncbi:MAG: polysaccharide pyruvyl transferase family protein [Lachnobacterium sp.]|nr:polysaccharide pyruvyl transferase family protein [Lachnobacterium sp.]MDD7713029.1 polysaccharide pyruvyl transferase family protein [Lachnobacterium sp.]MDY5460712.1 polysaccharide pyruvyl transferase family protein [Agathobacter sp.]